VFGTHRLRLDHLDASYRRVRGRDELGSRHTSSTVVDASRCAHTLPYFLLHEVDV
jgi:hypothetical protein